MRTRIGTQGAVRVAFGTVVVKHVHAAVQSDRGKEHECSVVSESLEVLLEIIDILQDPYRTRHLD